MQEAQLLSKEIRINREKLAKFIAEVQHELHHRIRSGLSSQIVNVDDVSRLLYNISPYKILSIFFMDKCLFRAEKEGYNNGKAHYYVKELDIVAPGFNSYALFIMIIELLY